KVTLAGTGATFNDASGATISTGTVSGQGVFNSTLTASGAASVTASGGTLEMVGAISGGSPALTVGSGASDKLLLDAADAATSATFSGSTGTLELNTLGTLTLTNALAGGTNTVKLDGAGSQLTDNAGGSNAITLSTGTISGVGVVSGAITASGAAHIPASGGTLEIANAITNTGTLALTVGSGASDKLLLDAADAA